MSDTPDQKTMYLQIILAILFSWHPNGWPALGVSFSKIMNLLVVPAFVLFCMGMAFEGTTCMSMDCKREVMV